MRSAAAGDGLDRADAAQYWDDVGTAWTADRPDALWRACCDRRNAALVRRWLTATRPARLLKTDTFDEAVSDGLFETLSLCAGRVSGLDISPVIARAARDRHPTFDATAGDVRHLPYADDAFDAIVSISTLDHFDSRDDIPRALVEIHRILRPGGGLLITLDNETNPLVAVRNRLPFALLHRIGLVPYRVGRSCSGRTLRRMLDACGFDVRALTYVEHCPRLVAVRVARLVDRTAGDGWRSAFTRAVAACERLEHWPLRAITGHYVAAWAVKT